MGFIAASIAGHPFPEESVCIVQEVDARSEAPLPATNKTVPAFGMVPFVDGTDGIELLPDAMTRTTFPSLESQTIVDSNRDLLFRAKIALGRLNGGVPQKKLDLLEIATILTAQLCAGPAKIVGAKPLDPDLLGRLLDHRPDRSVAQLFPDELPALRKRLQQASVLDLGRDHPGVDSMLHPKRYCHGANPAALAAEIYQDPSSLAHLDPVHVQAGQLLPAQGAAQQQGQNGIVSLPFGLRAVRNSQ